MTTVLLDVEGKDQHGRAFYVKVKVADLLGTVTDRRSSKPRLVAY